MRNPTSPCRRDSIDELADILLEDTVMDNYHYNQAIGMHLPDDTVVSGNHTSKHSAHLESYCAPGLTHECSKRHLTSMEPVRKDQLDGQRVEDTSPINAIKACGHSTAQHAISQTKSFMPNWGNMNINMQGVTTIAKDSKPDNFYSLPREPYTPVDYCHWRRDKSLDEGAKLDYQQEERPSLTKSVGSSGPLPTCHGTLQYYPSESNAVDLNSKVEAMLAATKALKPDLTQTLLPGLELPDNSSHLKDSNILVKMKTAMNNHFQTRVNKKPPELAGSVGHEVALSQPTLTTMAIRMNEG